MYLLLSGFRHNFFKGIAKSHTHAGIDQWMDILPCQSLQAMLGLLAKFSVDAILRRQNVQMDHMEQDDSDTGTSRQTVHQRKRVQRASCQINRK